MVTYAAPWWRRSRAVRIGGLGVLLYGAMVLPWFSFSRKPADVRAVLVDRDALTTLEAPANLDVLRAVRTLTTTSPAAVWVITSQPIAAQFTFYDLLRDREVLARGASVTSAFLARVQQAWAGRDVYVLSLSQDLPESIAGLDVVQVFPGKFPNGGKTRIYRYRARGA